MFRVLGLLSALLLIMANETAQNNSSQSRTPHCMMDQHTADTAAGTIATNDRAKKKSERKEAKRARKKRRKEEKRKKKKLKLCPES